MSIVMGYRPDHSIITLNLSQEKAFNNDLLSDKQYLEKIQIVIHDKKIRFPIYNLENIDTVSDNEVQFTITGQLLLETLLMEIRSATICIQN